MGSVFACGLYMRIDARGVLWACGFDSVFADRGSGLAPVEHGQGDVGSLRWLATGEDGSLYVSTSQGLLWRDRGRLPCTCRRS